MSNITGFGSYGYSNEDGSCDYDGASPNWASTPPASIMATNWGSSSGNDDIAVWRPGNGTWYKRGLSPTQLGQFGDLPAPGYYADAVTARPTVYRPCQPCASSTLSYWYVEDANVPGSGVSHGDYNGNGTTDSLLQWGERGDIPVPGDYDGGSLTDFVVWRLGNGTWYIRYRSGPTASVQLGQAGDIPVPGDYNGDGRTDMAVWRPCAVCAPPFLSYWYIENVALSGETQGDFNGNGTTDTKIQWGVRGDIPVPGDYYGSARTDFAVWRPGASPSPYWYVRGLPALLWGSPGDVPVPGDYDSVWADEALWRPCGVCGPSSLAYWYLESVVLAGAAHGDYNGNGTIDSQVQWGETADIPLAGRHGR